MDHIGSMNPDAILVDGYNDCIVGFTDDGRVVYEQTLMVAKLIREEGMGWEEALEYLDFNTFNAYVGEFTPLFIVLFDSKSLKNILDGERSTHHL